jgi:hypothetical protein
MPFLEQIESVKTNIEAIELYNAELLQRRGSDLSTSLEEFAILRRFQAKYRELLEMLLGGVEGNASPSNEPVSGDGN